VRRAAQDEKLVSEMAQSIQRTYPKCPKEEEKKIARHTAERRSGRVGRSAAGRNVEEPALELAVAAWIRHRCIIDVCKISMLSLKPIAK